MLLSIIDCLLIALLPTLFIKRIAKIIIYQYYFVFDLFALQILVKK